MKKILIIQETLSSYNDPIYELISKEVDLTVAYTFKCEIQNAAYKILQLEYKAIGPFVFHKNVKRILLQYDAVIFVPHLKFIRLIVLPFFKHPFKVLTWSIGVHASYTEPFDLTKKPTFKDRIFELIQDHADAAIFYMQEPIDYWAKYKKIDKRHYFVAHNTVKVADFGCMPPFESRTSLLFVGTLYSQKGLGELIDAYKLALNQNNSIPNLLIVGKGPEKELLENQIKELRLSDRIKLCGAIYDEEVLKDYFLNAIMCISPKQAGLSVQKSLGYGVPFVTRPDAITGGERLDVIDGYNGIYYKTKEELAGIIVKSVTDPKIFRELSVNARNYYINEASPEIMANGALTAIKYTLTE